MCALELFGMSMFVNHFYICNGNSICAFTSLYIVVIVVVSKFSINNHISGIIVIVQVELCKCICDSSSFYECVALSIYQFFLLHTH